MIQVPPGFGFADLISDFFKFIAAFLPVAVLGLGYKLVSKVSRRSTR